MALIDEYFPADEYGQRCVSTSGIIKLLDKLEALEQRIEILAAEKDCQCSNFDNQVADMINRSSADDRKTNDD